jgi:hypothetical protein
MPILFYLNPLTIRGKNKAAPEDAALSYLAMKKY